MLPLHELIERSIRAFSEYFQNFFVYEENLLSKIDPRVKVVGFTILAILSVSTFEIEKILFIIISIYLLAFLSGISMIKLMKRSYLFPLFSFFIVLPTMFFGEPFSYVLIFSLRVFAAISSLQLLIISTPFNDVISALRALKVPEKLLNSLWVTYIYSYILVRDLLAILIARESRRVKRSGHIETMKRGGEALGLFMLRSMEKGEKVALAMKLRGEPIGKVKGSKLLIPYFLLVVVWWTIL